MSSLTVIDSVVITSVILIWLCADLYYDFVHKNNANSPYPKRLDWFIGEKLNASQGSNRRRRLTIAVGAFSFCIYVYGLSESLGVGEFVYSPQQVFLGYFFVASSLAYFFYVIIFMVLRYSPSFKTNSLRLIYNTAISASFNIAAFSILYLFKGIKSGENCLENVSLPESIYFSTVTFSTLGYGDYSPCEPSRFWAGLEAIIGNVHLGVFVAALFSILGRD